MYLANLSSWDVTIIIAALSLSQKKCATDEARDEVSDLIDRIKKQLASDNLGLKYHS